MDAFFWIVAALLIGMGGYTGYLNWKQYFQARKVKEQYRAAHQDVRVYKAGTVRCWLYLLMIAACVGLMIMILVLPQTSITDQNSRYAQALVYFGLAIFAVAMYGEALTDNEILYTPDSFVYEADVVRFKSIRAIVSQKGMFKNSTLSLQSGKDYPLSKKTALWLQTQWEDWKENRKSSFKSRKERRAEARRERGRR